MNELFAMRVLTASVNAIKAPKNKIFNRLFKKYAKPQISDLLQFDIISGKEELLGNISVEAEATVTDVTGRKTVTMQAPRLAQKRFIPAALLNSYRAAGKTIGAEMMKDRIALEQMDMLGLMNRTLEYWAAGAMRGKIYDKDMTTVLVDYNLPATHTAALTGTDLWTDAGSAPLKSLRGFKRLIEDDCDTTIDGWLAYVGADVMDALLDHDDVREMLKTGKGTELAETGRIKTLAEIELDEYNASFVHTDATRKRYVESDHILLIGLCDQLVDCPFAPVVDDDAPGGVGNVDTKGKGQLYFSKSWKKNDPSGRWIKIETRPLPVLKRPGAVIYKKVV